MSDIKALKEAAERFDAAQGRYRTLMATLDEGPGRLAKLQGQIKKLEDRLHLGELSDQEAQKVGTELAAAREQFSAALPRRREQERLREDRTREVAAAKTELVATLKAHFRKVSEPALQRVAEIINAAWSELDALDDKRAALAQEYGRGLGTPGPNDVHMALNGVLSTLRLPLHLTPSELAQREELRKSVEAAKNRERQAERENEIRQLQGVARGGQSKAREFAHERLKELGAKA